MHWRLQLDVPYSFAVEPGLKRSQWCGDFRPDGKGVSNTIHDPHSGLVMLRPNLFDDTYRDTLTTLDSFRHIQEAWKEVLRARDRARMWSTIQPAGSAGDLIRITADIGLVLIGALAEREDILYWALQSRFLLEPDEGFALHYHGVADEHLRKNNWLYIQRDIFGIHLSHQGLARVYLYPDRGNLAAQPSLVHQFQFAAPGEILQRHGWMMFLPIPTVGVLFYHGWREMRGASFTSAAAVYYSRGHLIPFPSYLVDGGYARMWEASPVSIAVNPHHRSALGFQRLVFPASGTFADGVFSPKYKPSVMPNIVAAVPLNTQQQSISASLMKPDLSGAWATGDRQARVQCSLSTTSVRHTPFLYGYAVGWPPVMATRSTTAFQPSKLLSVEYTQDEQGRFEGKAEMILDTAAARRIAERGDATFLLERRASESDPWSTVEGGFAQEWDIEAEHGSGFGSWHRASCVLRGLWARLEEVHQTVETALDGMTVTEAVGTVLSASGFPTLLSTPPEADEFRIPIASDAKGWRWAPRPGDSGAEIIEKLLFMLRSQGVEFRLRYDWTAQGWVLERKPAAIAAWTLTPYSANENPAALVSRYSAMRLQPEPPEGNVIRVEGYASTDSDNGTAVVASNWVNQDSLTNTSSPDYLGRMKLVTRRVAPVTDQNLCNLMARAIGEAASHRRLKGSISIPIMQAGIVPLTPVVPLESDGGGPGQLWAKRVTVQVEPGMPEAGPERMVLEVDSVWAGEVRA